MPLLFGLPVPEARSAAADGLLALGGCILPENAPNWQCPEGHRWHEPDEHVWDERLLAALTAHGYVDYDDLD